MIPLKDVFHLLMYLKNNFEEKSKFWPQHVIKNKNKTNPFDAPHPVPKSGEFFILTSSVHWKKD